MDSPAQIIADNVARIRERISQAAQAAGRDAADVALIAVSKYVGAAESAALLAAGCRDLGESRPQQLWEKASLGELSAARWHLVGHLQRNKVRRTLPLATLIHSVDSRRLLAAIDAAASDLDLQPRVLLEVNTSGEAQKHGVQPEQLPELIEAAGDYPRVRVAGLMTMAAREGGPQAAQPCFASLRRLRDDLRCNCPSSVQLDELSMGMSRDFPQAIAEGATLVRVGSILFEGVA